MKAKDKIIQITLNNYHNIHLACKLHQCLPNCYSILTWKDVHIKVQFANINYLKHMQKKYVYTKMWNAMLWF